MPELYKCPACQQFKDVTLFSARPVDQRCDVCLPVDVAMVAYDKKVQLAGSKYAAILDAADAGGSLAPVERLLASVYEQWGGEHAFARDLMESIKALRDADKHHSAAQHMIGLTKLHAKIDHMRLEDDWRNMDDSKVEATLQRKLKALMEKMERDEAGPKAIEGFVQP